MATTSADAGTIRTAGIAPLSADRTLGFVSILMLAIVLVALGRGHAHWAEVPLMVWGHLAMLIPVLALTPFILAGRKGGLRHRTLGYIWAALLVGIAAQSFLIPLTAAVSRRSGCCRSSC
ncbi:MAG: hypothetical protein JWO65_707 [Sphingomonas bacterium]|nr:hypothetical protein [Sphingomonas bacterium]